MNTAQDRELHRKELLRAYSQSCTSMDELAEGLEPFFIEAPSIFGKNIDEMGASEKMKCARDILNIVNAFSS